MMHVLKALLFGSSLAICCAGPGQDGEEARAMLRSLSVGERPASFTGRDGLAVKKLREQRNAQNAELQFDVLKGDAPAPLGDGSCDFHVLVSRAREISPFLGLRLKKQRVGWVIVGYWSPTTSK